MTRTLAPGGWSPRKARLISTSTRERQEDSALDHERVDQRRRPLQRRHGHGVLDLLGEPRVLGQDDVRGWSAG